MENIHKRYDQIGGLVSDGEAAEDQDVGLAIRAATVGHIPPVNFIIVTMGSTAVLLIGWRTLLFSILPTDKPKKNDVYKSGSPFELFETLPLSFRALTAILLLKMFGEAAMAEHK
ncbi:hypothetical protein HAX54_042373, partial [Datura stramonium]|nr:hypothetical protein [Datura stramonium]